MEDGDREAQEHTEGESGRGEDDWIGRVSDWATAAWPYAEGHLGVATAFLVGVIVVIRVAWVSGFNASTAAAIIRYQSTAGIILGVVASLVPSFLFYLLLIAGVALLDAIRVRLDARPRRWKTYTFVWDVALFIFLVSVGARYVEWWLFIVVVGIWVWAFVGSPEHRNYLKWNYALLAGAVLLQLILLGNTILAPRRSHQADKHRRRCWLRPQ